MFHGVGVELQQNRRMELKDLKEMLEHLESEQRLMSDILARHTDLEIPDLEKLFLQMSFISSDDAIKYGIVDEVTDISLSETDLPIHQIMFN